MAPELIAVETDTTLPRRADVVIIGGGIAGVSTLLALAEKGVSAVLVEKGHLAGEQSSRNWGFCRTQGRAQSEVPLALESLRQWDRMDQRVGGEVAFTRAGACYLCETPQEVAAYEAWLEHIRVIEYLREYVIDRIKRKDYDEENNSHSHSGSHSGSDMDVDSPVRPPSQPAYPALPI